MNLATVLSIASCIFGCPPNDAGTIVVVGGDLKMLQFAVPGDVDYRLTYNTSRLALWFDVGATQSAPPNTTFQSLPAQIEHGDMNLDGAVNGKDIQIFVDVFLGNNTNPVLIAQADFDENSVLNSNDTALFANALLSGVTATSTVTVFTQGLSASAGLCDTPVNILTDEDENGIFVLAGTIETTVASLTASPTMGVLGTPVTLTITPAITPLIFNTTTTASWTGVYDPTAGPASSTFSMSYSTAQVREQTTATAVIVLGDGTPSSTPSPSGLTEPGTFVGVLTANFQGTLVAKPVQLTISDPPFLAHVVYADTSTMSGVAQRGNEITETPVLFANEDTMAAPSLAAVQAAGWAHMVPVLFLEQNAFTTASAPATVSARVATFDAVDAVIAQTATLTLTRVPDPDGDPNHIIYAGDVNTPLVLLNVVVNPVNYPGFVVLFMPASAVDVRVIPAN